MVQTINKLLKVQTYIYYHMYKYIIKTITKQFN